MTPEQLYQKEFGDILSIPKESVIKLLRHFALVLREQKNDDQSIRFGRWLLRYAVMGFYEEGWLCWKLDGISYTTDDVFEKFLKQDKTNKP
jgi:uncharacterized NAD(P)/FAD-binding protein YdhS